MRNSGVKINDSRRATLSSDTKKLTLTFAISSDITSLSCSRNCNTFLGEGAPVDFLRHLYISIRESSRGQTMTEYALILGAIAVVVYAGYQSLGTHVNSGLTVVDNLL
jgi:Flp pilus assembly pilin Flp